MKCFICETEEVFRNFDVCSSCIKNEERKKETPTHMTLSMIERIRTDLLIQGLKLRRVGLPPYHFELLKSDLFPLKSYGECECQKKKRLEAKELMFGELTLYQTFEGGAFLFLADR